MALSPMEHDDIQQGTLTTIQGVGGNITSQNCWRYGHVVVFSVAYGATTAIMTQSFLQLPFLPKGGRVDFVAWLTGGKCLPIYSTDGTLRIVLGSVASGESVIINGTYMTDDF